MIFNKVSFRDMSKENPKRKMSLMSFQHQTRNEPQHDARKDKIQPMQANSKIIFYKSSTGFEGLENFSSVLAKLLLAKYQFVLKSIDFNGQLAKLTWSYDIF